MKSETEKANHAIPTLDQLPVSTNQQVILDIGCSVNKRPGHVGIDIDPATKPDYLHDLNVYPYPLADNSVDRINATHIIEHLDDPRAFMKELCRILKVGGTAFVETPHFSSRVAYSEPQHKLFYSYFMFNELLRGVSFKVLRQKITFFKYFRAIGLAALFNRFPDTYERFWTYMFPAENVLVEVEKI